MAAVSDTETCTAADAGAKLAIPSVTVTGWNLADGAGAPAQGLVVFDAGQLEVMPSTGGAGGVFENPAVAQVYAGAMTPVTLPDSSRAFAASFTYTVTLKLEGFTDLQFPGVVISRDRFPSGSCDVSQLV